MSSARKLFSVSIVGAVVGGLLAAAAPLTAATAESGCKCDDDAAGSSKYQCSKDQSACNAGTEFCVIVCAN